MKKTLERFVINKICLQKFGPLELPNAPLVEGIVEGGRDKGGGEDGEDHVEDGHNEGARVLDAGGP